METNLAHEFEEGRLSEIIGGKVVMMASPSLNHNRVAGNIYNLFSNYLQDRPCEPFQDGASLFSERQKSELRDAINALFSEGYRVLFRRQSALMESCHLYEDAALQAVLREVLPERTCQESRVLASADSNDFSGLWGRNQIERYPNSGTASVSQPVRDTRCSLVF